MRKPDKTTNEVNTSAKDSIPSATNAYELPSIPDIIFTLARMKLESIPIKVVLDPRVIKTFLLDGECESISFFKFALSFVNV